MFEDVCLRFDWILGLEMYESNCRVTLSNQQFENLSLVV